MICRPRTMRRLRLACAGAGLLLSGEVRGQIKVQDRSRFCVKRGGTRVAPKRRFGESISETFAVDSGNWALQLYPPLIDTHSGSVFEQVIYTGKWLSKVRLKVFREDYGLTIDYKFDESGGLISTQGAIFRGGEWNAEAKLYSDGKGGISEPSVTFYRRTGGSPIQTPDDGRDYVPMLSSVPIFKAINEIPCAGWLQEAEKVNATQK